MLEKNLLQKIVTIGVSTLPLLTPDITPFGNDSDIAQHKYYDSTSTLFRNWENAISQNYCYNLPTDSEWYKEISEIQYGIHVYPLQNVIYGVWCKTNNKKNKFHFSALDLPNILGKGNTEENSLKSWEEDFHLKFQDIYYKQHWERTEEEQNLYNMFKKIVDIQGYLRLTPVSIKHTGKIINISGSKLEIEWLDESRDIVDLAECPDELSTYNVSEYFRAEMLRKFETNEIIKIRDVKRTNYRILTDTEVLEFFDSLPVKNLPPSKHWN
jgi:hypothetical protein